MASRTPEIWVTNEQGAHKLEGAELDAFLEQQAKDQAEIQARLDEENSKKAQREQILTRLGLTEDEAKIILG